MYCKAIEQNFFCLAVCLQFLPYSDHYLLSLILQTFIWNIKKSIFIFALLGSRIGAHLNSTVSKLLNVRATSPRVKLKKKS